LGEVTEIDMKKIIPDASKSIKKGGFAPLGESKSNWTFTLVEGLLKQHGYDLNTPIEEMNEEVVNALLYGSEETFEVTTSTHYTYRTKFEGIIAQIEKQIDEETSAGLKRWAESFMNKINCPECGGSRLKKESLFFRIAGKNIAELASMGLHELIAWFQGVEYKMSARQVQIATESLK
jgi:excinuclease ABC subunit A